MPEVIDRFDGKYRFLSNFSSHSIKIGGHTYKTAEHAFQAHKTNDAAQRGLVRQQPTPGRAKYVGRRVTLIKDWEDRKVDIMEMIVGMKFTQNLEARKALLETGDAKLIEGNTWGDTFWGVCRGRGNNELGKILMRVRESFRHPP